MATSIDASSLVWYTLLDPTTEQFFYACPATGACSWQPPKSGSILQGHLPDWWEMFDVGTNRPYYFNNTTQETLWVLPQDLNVIPVPLSYEDDVRIRNVLGPPPESSAAPEFTTEEVLDTPDDFTGESETTENGGDSTSPKASPRRLETNETTTTEWVAMEDPRTGYNYFMNRRTMKIAWSRVEMLHQEIEVEMNKPTPLVEAPSPVAYQVRKSNDPGYTSDAWEDPSAAIPMPALPTLPGMHQTSSTLALAEGKSSPMPARAPPTKPSSSATDSTKTTGGYMESRKGSLATPVAQPSPTVPSASSSASNAPNTRDPSIPSPPPSSIPQPRPYRSSIFMRPLPDPSKSATRQSPAAAPKSRPNVASPAPTTAVPAPPPMPKTATQQPSNRPIPASSPKGGSSGTPTTSYVPNAPFPRPNEAAGADVKPRSGSQVPPVSRPPTRADDSASSVPAPSSGHLNGIAKPRASDDIDINADVINVSAMFRRPMPTKKDANQSSMVNSSSTSSLQRAQSSKLPTTKGISAKTTAPAPVQPAKGPSGVSHIPPSMSNNKTTPPSSISSGAHSARQLPPKPFVGGPPPMPTGAPGGTTSPNRTRPTHSGSRPPAYAPPNPAVLVTMMERNRSGSRANRVSFRASISRVAPPTLEEMLAAENGASTSPPSSIRNPASSAPTYGSPAPISTAPMSFSYVPQPGAASSTRNPAIGPVVGLPPQRAVPVIPMPPPAHSTSPVKGVRTSHSAHTIGGHMPSPYAMSTPASQMEGRGNPAISGTSSHRTSSGSRQRPPLVKAFTATGGITQPVSSSSASPRPTISPDLKAQINFFQLEGFAARFFKSQKRGLFRRAVPIRDRLKWTQGSLKTPLLKLKPDMAKKALNLFKWIQICMGDRELTSTQEERHKLMVEIFDIGLNIAALRDEIFCQLCKQTTLNPNTDSNLRGWGLIALFLQYFTPTKDLEHWFMDFCREHEKNPQVEIRPYVAYVLRLLTRGPSQSGSTLRVPDIDEVELALRNPIQPRLFGVTLEAVLEAQQQHSSSVPEIQRSPNFPYVISALTSIIHRLKGTTTEGIFRIPGSHMLCTKLRLQIEAGNYSGAGILDPHVPASVLKWWLRDLEEPVIPPAFYNRCLDAARSDPQAVAQACTDVVDSLPSLNKAVVYTIINFVQILARPENVAHTKMAVGSLAIVFGPNLLRCQAVEMVQVFEAQRWEQMFVSTLIKSLPSSS